ncbi:DUF5959 family protein [Streptomyces sp. NBC_01438]
MLGRRSPGVLHLHDLLDAEVLVTSGFVSGRLAMALRPSDLESWARALDRLSAGQDICWRDDDHSPEIRIQPYNEEHETVAVRVEDLGSSCVSVLSRCASKRAGSMNSGGCSCTYDRSGRARSSNLHGVYMSGGAELATAGADR